MFGQFLHIVVSCLKLDRNIFKDPKYYGEAAIYFAGLIIEAAIIGRTAFLAPLIEIDPLRGVPPFIINLSMCNHFFCLFNTIICDFFATQHSGNLITMFIVI